MSILPSHQNPLDPVMYFNLDWPKHPVLLDRSELPTDAVFISHQGGYEVFRHPQLGQSIEKRSY